LVAGVAPGALALAVGAPARAGGLGLAAAAGATTGATPFLYFDGPWIATLLPYMPPLDPKRIIGGNGLGGPDPAHLLADFELEFEKTFSPPPNHPILGTPYAIPLDGTSQTVDLLRSVSGAVAGVAFGGPVDPATFLAAPVRSGRRAVGHQDAARGNERDRARQRRTRRGRHGRLLPHRPFRQRHRPAGRRLRRDPRGRSACSHRIARHRRRSAHRAPGVR